jgi:probable rRNA maturation factor
MKENLNNNLSINNQTKGKLPSLPFDNLKCAVLGKDYELSLNFVSPNLIHRLNRSYRNIDKATDILSFPLEKNAGEIFICRSAANKKAPQFGRTKENYLAFLVIHGLVHLKGFEHSSKMESVENKYRKKFGI